MQYHNFDRQENFVRKSNIELLRIIAMIIIVAHHFAVHSGFDFSTNSITINRLWTQLIQIGGKIGVDVFVLISGYFLITTNKIKISKVLKLWLQILTYSILFFFVFVGLGIQPFSLKELIKCLLPITFSEWWFASVYFVLYLLTPYINRLLSSLTPKEYQRMLILLTIIWCIIPTFLTKSWGGNELLWFVYLYALAGYLRLYGNLQTGKAKWYIIFSVGLTILTYLSAVFFDLLGKRYAFFGEHATYFYQMSKLPILLISITLFIGFLGLNIRYSRFINTIASATFGIYLIHDNVFVRPFIWETVFEDALYSDRDILIPYSLMVIALVFVVCMLIELFRVYVVEKRYMKLVNVLSDKISNGINNFLG